MPLEHASTSTSFIDVLDRVLDKGIVIDAWVRGRVVMSIFDLLSTHARIVVVSVDTY
jgi:hypothetical protein